MANITTVELANTLATIVAQEALLQLNSYLTIAKFVTRDWQNEIAQRGKAIQIPILGDLAVTDKVENTPIVYSNPSDTAVIINLNKHKYVAFKIEDRARALSSVDAFSGYMKTGVQRMAEQVDRDLLTLFQSATYTVGTAGTAPTSNTIQAARLKFNQNLVPESSIRHYVVNPVADDAILQDTKIYNSYVSQLAVIKTGESPDIWGFSAHKTQLVTATGSAPVTTWNGAWTPEAMTLVTRPLDDESVMPGLGTPGVVQSSVDDGNGLGVRVTLGYDLSNLGLACVIDLLYGVGIIRQQLMCGILG